MRQRGATKEIEAQGSSILRAIVVGVVLVVMIMVVVIVIAAVILFVAVAAVVVMVCVTGGVRVGLCNHLVLPLLPFKH